MRLICISDIHGKVAALARLSEVFAGADLVLISGDITNFGGKREAACVMGELRKHAKRVLAVGGNCDGREVNTYLQEEGISLDGSSVLIENFAFYGFSGALGSRGETPNELSEEDISWKLSQVVPSRASGLGAILLCHQPPYGTKMDLVESGAHVGSRVLRDFILEHRPVVCFCGHIHTASGIDMLGRTTLVNPGPVYQGGYAVVDMADGFCRAVVQKAGCDKCGK